MSFFLITVSKILDKQEGGENMNELKEMLMEQLQLLHERSKSGDYMPGGLVDLSNAMAHIAEVLVQIRESNIRAGR